MKEEKSGSEFGVLPRQPRGWVTPLLAFLAVAVTGICLSHFTPLGHYLNTDSIRSLAEGLGWRGPLVLLGIALVAPLLFLPRWPIAMVCGMLYGVAFGTLLGTICGAAGAWVQYTVALRTLSPVADQWEGASWMSRLAHHRDRAFTILFCLRTLPFTSSVATNLLAGTLRVRTSTFLAATFLGMIPSTLMYAAWGKLLKQPSPGFYLLASGIVVLFLAGAWIARRRVLAWLNQAGEDLTCQPSENRQAMEPPKNLYPMKEPTMKVKKAAMLTAGGLAPCLSSAVGGLIERYTEIAPDVELIAYTDGYKGLLLGNSITVDAEMREHASVLHKHGGSPVGNSRVKLTNVKDCLKRGLVEEGQDPLKVAADQLTRDGVDVLHTIGGDDTNTTAADLAAYLKNNNYDLLVVGLPKTIDNDVIPIRQSLGAWTAAEQGARFFRNIVAEHSANPRMLIVHEVMGRNCGWLTAYTAKVYREKLHELEFVPGIGLKLERRDVHGVFVPEMELDIAAEAARLKQHMDDFDCVNVFVSEGAGVSTIIQEMESRGEEVPRDAFGHPRLDAVNPGAWFAKQFGKMIGAEKTMVQKSGYFSRAAPANAEDLELIKACTTLAVDAALRGESGVVGHDEDQDDTLRPIEFERILGGKPFDIDTPWFEDLLAAIGQAKGRKLEVEH